MTKKMTTAQFIERACQKHGDKFDYSKVGYTRAHGEIVVICPEHGEFTQKAHSHLNGRGCRKCAGLERRSLLSFVQAAQRVHGDAPKIEKQAHKLMQSAKLKGFSGATEWFRHDYDQEYAAHKLAVAAGVEL